MRPSLISVATALAVWSVAFNGDAAQCTGSVITAESVVGFSGCISDEAANVFIAALNARSELVLLQSNGGDVSAALRMAQAIAIRKLPVTVRGVCHSSCANYLMPAGASISVERNALVGFHGDARLTIDRMKGATDESREASRAMGLILQEEEALANSVPRVALVHELQAIASAPFGSTVELKRAGGDLVCAGQGILPWFPSLEMLQELKVIDHVVEPDHLLLPQLQLVTSETPPSKSERSLSPLSGCRPR